MGLAVSKYAVVRMATADVPSPETASLSFAPRKALVARSASPPPSSNVKRTDHTTRPEKKGRCRIRTNVVRDSGGAWKSEHERIGYTLLSARRVWVCLRTHPSTTVLIMSSN